MCSPAALEGLRQLLDSPLLFNIKVDPNFFRTETLQTQSPRIAARSCYRVQWEFMAEVNSVSKAPKESCLMCSSVIPVKRSWVYHAPACPIPCSMISHGWLLLFCSHSKEWLPSLTIKFLQEHRKPQPNKLFPSHEKRIVCVPHFLFPAFSSSSFSSSFSFFSSFFLLSFV